jgi:hypothetical protein
MEVGDRVRVRTVSGKVGVRVVVGFSEYGPILCSESEYEAATKEGREPEGLGWPEESILGLADREHEPV